MSHISASELDRVLKRAKTDDALGKRIADALALIEGVLDELGECAVALSFNGGKDCTVLLHLFAAVLYARHTDVPSSLKPQRMSIPPLPTSLSTPRSEQPSARSEACEAYLNLNGPAEAPPPLPPCITSNAEVHATATHHTPVDPSHEAPYPLIRSVYFTAPNPFPALEAFVIDSATYYAMDLYRFGGGMKAALSEYLDCQGGKDIRAILLGTRQGDPNGNVSVLAPTDPSWPQVLRVHPVLNWTYHEIWDFLRELDVPYCKLYDDGYTSLGSTNNTERNPLLKAGDGWDPAWKLADPTQERAGRIKRPA